MRSRTNLLTLACVVGIAASIAWAGPTPDPVKWSQPPVVVQEDPRLIYGWDEVSMTDFPVVADDFKCTQTQYITDLHWWGSYPDYIGEPGQPEPIRPRAFLIRFWDDVPAGPNNEFSHPGRELHKIVCEKYEEERVGYDVDPFSWDQGDPIVRDICFQYNQVFERDEWFLQEGTERDPRIYWVSIQAVYDPGTDVPYPWGWKTTEYRNIDAAVVSDPGPEGWYPIIAPHGGDRWWDMAYELSVPEPGTMLLLTVGAGLAVLRRRRRR
jgi:hypothetical protein